MSGLDSNWPVVTATRCVCHLIDKRPIADENNDTGLLRAYTTLQLTKLFIGVSGKDISFHIGRFIQTKPSKQQSVGGKQQRNLIALGRKLSAMQSVVISLLSQRHTATCAAESRKRTTQLASQHLPDSRPTSFFSASDF